MRNYFPALFFVAFLLFSGAAKAFAPILVYAGLSLASVVGSTASYFVIENIIENSQGDGVDVVYVTDESVSDDDIKAQYESTTFPPNTATPSVRFPVTYTIPAGGFNTSGSDYTIMANSITELLDAINYLPSDVAKYHNDIPAYGNVPAYWAPNYRDSYTGYDFAYLNGIPHLRLSFRIVYTMHHYYFPAVGADCPAGYDFNLNSGVCDLVDLAIADEPDVCIVRGGEFNPSSGGCWYPVDAGLLTLNSDPETGSSATTAVASDGTIISMGMSQGSDPVISIVKSIPQEQGGGHTREDVTVDSSGNVGTSVSTFYPQAPPPLYPGDDGSSLPSSSFPNPGDYTSGGSTCGGSGQPPCATEGMPELVESNNQIRDSIATIKDSVAGQPVEDSTDVELSDSGDSLTSSYDEVVSRVSFGTVDFSLGEASCPPISLHFSLYERPFDYDSTAFCDLIEGTGENPGIRPLIEAVFLLSWVLLSIRVVLEA